MARSTQLRTLQAKGICGWIADVVHAVAIDAGRDVGITLFGEGCSMHAGAILLVDGVVAPGAGGRDAETSGWH